MHVVVPNAPFGGVGGSGHGSYHGKYGFDAFSHERTVLSMPTWMDKLLAFRYPPWNMANLSKIAVKNSLGFKRGETMADQKIKKGRGMFVLGSDKRVARGGDYRYFAREAFVKALGVNGRRVLSVILAGLLLKAAFSEQTVLAIAAEWVAFGKRVLFDSWR
jgi:hypothetical protein